MDDYINVNEASMLLWITTHWVRKLIHEDRLNWKKEMWLYYITKESLEKYRQQRNIHRIGIPTKMPHTILERQNNVLQLKNNNQQRMPITEYIGKIENNLYWDMIAYVSSRTWKPGSIITPNDCMQLDDLLNLLKPKYPWNWDKKFKKLILYISSPWWILESSVKIIDIIKQYSESFEVIVPYMAKSAASLICLAADKIYMTTIAELWPIDPIIENPSRPWNTIPAKAIDDFIKYYLNETNKWWAISNALLRMFENKIDPYLLGSRKSALEYSQQEIKKAVEWKIDSSLLDNTIKTFTLDNVSHNHPITYSILKDIWLKNIVLLRDWEILNDVKWLFTTFRNYIVKNNISKTFRNRDRWFDIFD